MQELLAHSPQAPGGGAPEPGHQDNDRGDLLARAQAGDHEALDQLCRDNWLPVYRAVSRWARSPAEAEDLTQEVFLRALQALGRLRDPSMPYRAYLIRVARNLVIDKWRERKVEVAGDLPDGPDLAAGPEAAAISSDESRWLIAALDRLPDDYSDVLRLRIMHGLTAAEVGERRGQTANAVRQLQFRAIAALRKELAAGTGAHQ